MSSERQAGSAPYGRRRFMSQILVLGALPLVERRSPIISTPDESPTNPEDERNDQENFQQFVGSIKAALSRGDASLLSSLVHPTEFKWGEAYTDFAVDLSPQEAVEVWRDALEGRSPSCERFYDLDWRIRDLFGENPALFVSGVKPLTFRERDQSSAGTILFLAKENDEWYIKKRLGVNTK